MQTFLHSFIQIESKSRGESWSEGERSGVTEVSPILTSMVMATYSFLTERIFHSAYQRCVFVPTQLTHTHTHISASESLKSIYPLLLSPFSVLIHWTKSLIIPFICPLLSLFYFFKVSKKKWKIPKPLSNHATAVISVLYKITTISSIIEQPYLAPNIAEELALWIHKFHNS